MQTAREIYQKAISLKPQEQAELVDKLLDHLDSPDKEIDDLWKKEPEHRVDAYEQSNLKAVSLNEIIAKYKQA
ncbi:MAG: addiction module protein [Chlorobiaceae bacterium]|nr:addiction module protein [Chlorobiaceae bacterium]